MPAPATLPTFATDATYTADGDPWSAAIELSSATIRND